MERSKKHRHSADVLAPAANHFNDNEYSEFYTGGRGKRKQNNVDTRNMIAQAFLNKNTPFALCNQPPAQNVAAYPPAAVAAYPPAEYYERGGSRSRSHSRRRRPRHWHYDSSPSTSPERERNRSIERMKRGSSKRKREYKDDKYSHSSDEEGGKSIVRID